MNKQGPKEALSLSKQEIKCCHAAKEMLSVFEKTEKALQKIYFYSNIAFYVFLRKIKK